MSKTEPTFYPYRLIVRKVSERKPDVLAGITAHACKSYAGMLVHHESIKSVTVVDVDGNSIFNLVKDENGHIIETRTVNVPSELAAYAV